MVTKKSNRQRVDEKRAADERVLREANFSFHPDILAEAGPLPRKSDGSGYTKPEPEGDGKRA